jgi:hypothetical protein
MEEKTFFEYEDVKVTNARFVTGGQTYAMNNVTSVKTHKQTPSRLVGVLVLIVGFGVAVSNWVIGIIIMAASAYYLYQQKTTYHVMLTTSGGETSALKTHQIEYITKVVSALNEAIVIPTPTLTITSRLLNCRRSNLYRTGARRKLTVSWNL